MKVPTNIAITLDVRAETEDAIRAGLIATLNALREGLQPNTVWGEGYCVGIRVPAGGSGK